MDAEPASDQHSPTGKARRSSALGPRNPPGPTSLPSSLRRAALSGEPPRYGAGGDGGRPAAAAGNGRQGQEAVVRVLVPNPGDGKLRAMPGAAVRPPFRPPCAGRDGGSVARRKERSACRERAGREIRRLSRQEMDLFLFFCSYVIKSRSCVAIRCAFNNSVRGRETCTTVGKEHQRNPPWAR